MAAFFQHQSESTRPTAKPLSSSSPSAVSSDAASRVFRLLFGPAGQQSVERDAVAIRLQPALITTNEELRRARESASRDPDQFRRTMRQIAQALADESIGYWLDHFGVKETGKAGRKRREFDKTEAQKIGYMIEQRIRTLKPLFQIKRSCTVGLGGRLKQAGASDSEIDAVMKRPTSKAAAIDLVAAGMISTITNRNLSRKTVANYHSLFLNHRKKLPKN